MIFVAIHFYICWAMKCLVLFLGFCCGHTAGAKRYILGQGGRCEVDDLDGIMNEQLGFLWHFWNGANTFEKCPTKKRDQEIRNYSAGR